MKTLSTAFNKFEMSAFMGRFDFWRTTTISIPNPQHYGISSDPVENLFESQICNPPIECLGFSRSISWI